MADDNRDIADATPDRDYDTVAELPLNLFPADRPKVPSILPPQGACDTYLHLLAGPDDLPHWVSRQADPDHSHGFEDWLDHLRMHMSTLELSRGVIFPSGAYDDDNSNTIEALERLGEGFVGMGLVRDDVSDEALNALTHARIRGILLDESPEGLLDWEGARRLAPRLADRGMHLDLELPAARLAELSGQIAELPCDVVIGDLGQPDITAGIDASDFQAVRRLVSEGRAYVRISGIYRLTPAPFEEAAPFVAALGETPERCLWGSDWPHLHLRGGDVPDAGVLLDRFFDHIPSVEARQTILVDTPAALYRF